MQILLKCAAAMALCLPASALATSCGLAPFGESVKTADLVAQVEIVRQRPALNGTQPQLEVRVLATYAGRAPSRTLRILGAAGLDTYPAIQNFPPGTRWVIALDRRDLWGKPLPSNIYAPSGCVQQGLLVSGPIAYGILDGGLIYPSRASSLPLSQLAAWVGARRPGKP